MCTDGGKRDSDLRKTVVGGAGRAVHEDIEFDVWLVEDAVRGFGKIGVKFFY